MINLAARFVLELAGIAAAAYLGSYIVAPSWRLVGGIAGGVAVATVWGLLLAPKAHSPIPLTAREPIGTILLLAVAAGLAASGRLWLGLGFGALLIANQAALLLIGPRTGEFA